MNGTPIIRHQWHYLYSLVRHAFPARMSSLWKCLTLLCGADQCHRVCVCTCVRGIRPTVQQYQVDGSFLLFYCAQTLLIYSYAYATWPLGNLLNRHVCEPSLNSDA